MEDLDDLFNDQLNDQLTDQINDHLNDQLNSQLNDPMNNGLNGQLQGHLDIASTPPPLPPGLAERLDGLRLSGCADKISWSKTGSIAYITKDHLNVRIASLAFRGSDGSWQRNDYTDPSLAESIVKVFKGRQIAHLSWNPNNISELLIADVHGRISIANIILAINRLQWTSVLNMDPEDSLNALVGLSWLNIKRQSPYGRNAQKLNGNWKYHLLTNEPRGPYGPHNRSAFITVTRNGFIRLGYQAPTPQAPGQQYSEERHDLDGFSSSDDLLTHAAITADKDDTLLVAVHTHSKKVRLYAIKIDWNLPKQGEQAPFHPTIHRQNVATINACYPSPEATMMPSSITPELSFLHIIPRVVQDQRNETWPFILATFTALAPQSMTGGAGELSYTTFSRWELRDETPVLDTSFSQLGSRKPGTAEFKTVKVLKRLDDVRVDRVPLAIQTLQHGTVFALMSYDGSVEFRARDLSVLPVDDLPDQVSSLPQLGCAFNDREPCLYMTLSPNNVVKAFFGKEHEIDTSAIQLEPAFVDNGGIATSEKLGVAFMLANAVSEVNNVGGNTNDDLLMAMQLMLKQLTTQQQDIMRSVFLKDIYTTFNFRDKLLDGLTSIDKVARHPQFLRCLSLQAALGNGGEKENRSLASKVAYTAMSMRNFALSSQMAFHKPPTSSEPELNKPDVLQYLIQLISWFGTLADHIYDQLLDLNRTLNVKDSFSLEAVRQQIAVLNTPVLHLVLCQFTRSLLRHNCRALRSIAPFTQSPHAAPGSPLHGLYASLVTIFRKNIINPPTFENLLTASDEIINKACEGLDVEQKKEIELSLLVLGEIPDVLSGAVQEILTVAAEKLRKENPNSMKVESNLAFKDWKILGLSDDPKSKRWRKETTFDAIRKIVLPKNARTRKCTRCDALMEDLFGPKMFNRTLVFQTMFRTCFCGGHFVLDPPPEA